MIGNIPNFERIPPELLVPDGQGAVDRQSKDCSDLFRAYIVFRNQGDDNRAQAALNALNARNCLPCPPVQECPTVPECPPQEEKKCPKPGSSLWWIIAVIVGATWMLSEPDTRK